VQQSAFVCVKFALNGLTKFSEHSQKISGLATAVALLLNEFLNRRFISNPNQKPSTQKPETF
jgi:hypothetical protein